MIRLLTTDDNSSERNQVALQHLGRLQRTLLCSKKYLQYIFVGGQYNTRKHNLRTCAKIDLSTRLDIVEFIGILLIICLWSSLISWHAAIIVKEKRSCLLTFYDIGE